MKISKITRCSLKREDDPVTVPFNTWFSFPFPATEAVRFSDHSDWHTAAHPERITPDVDGECLAMAKYNFLPFNPTDEVTAVATRFSRLKTDDGVLDTHEALDTTWTNELAAAAIVDEDGLWCLTANGPQKRMIAGQYWLAQLKVSGRTGGHAVVQTAEFILTGWHD
jgi:hypothetical protein